MITFLKGVNHGFGFFASPSVRGHLRPLDNDIGADYNVRIGCLHTVGRRLDEGSNTSNLRSFRVSYGHRQGEEK